MVRPRPMICLFRPCALTTMLTQTDDTTRACYAACRRLTPLVKSGRELQRFEPESDTLREGEASRDDHLGDIYEVHEA